MQNAVLRRPGNENSRIPHFLYIDEFPDFICKDTESIFTLYRKYKVATTITTQTLAKLEGNAQRMKYRKTILDFALGYLAFPFDFNFDKSNEIFAESAEAYANSIRTRYYKKLPEAQDRTTLINSCEHLVSQFEKYKKYGE